MSKLVTTGATALFVCILCATPLSLRLLPDGKVSLSTDTASAVIGRPLTPMSVSNELLPLSQAERLAASPGFDQPCPLRVKRTPASPSDGVN